MTYQLYFPIQHLSKLHSLSERALAGTVGLSRTCLRQVIQQRESSSISSIAALGSFFNRSVELLVSPETVSSESSTVAVAYQTERDGFESWKIHFMNLVDEYRRTLDLRLLILPPHSKFDPKLKALLGSLVYQLCQNSDSSIPHWARRTHFLDKPWFPAQMEALKASAIVESPFAFRRNNIFVLGNFLERA